LDLAALTPLVPALDGRAVSGSVDGALHLHGPLTPATPPAIDGSLRLANVGVGDPQFPTRVEGLSGVIALVDGNAELRDATARLGAAPLTLSCHAIVRGEPWLRCEVAAASLTPADLGVAGRPGDALRGLIVNAEVKPLDVPPLVHASLRAADGQAAGAPFRALEVDLVGGAETVTITHLAAHAFDGAVGGKAACRVGDRQPIACNLDLTVAAIQLTQLLASQHSPAAATVAGRTTGEAHVSSSGVGSEALLDNLRGTVRGTVTDGVLKHVNFAQQIVGALPGVGALVSGPRAHALLDSSETRFDAATATLQIAARRVSTDDAQVRAADFSASLKGSSTFAGQLSGRGSFTLSPALARELVQHVPILDHLSDDTGITLPFTLSGNLDSPRVRPDADALPKALQRSLSGGVEALIHSPDAAARAREEIKRALNRLLMR
ncbi:MAG: AsmA-like C-terminal region-containing protein, partial [bacterium]